MIMGIVASLQWTLADIATDFHLSIMFIFAGISFGIGMPSCLAYLAGNTLVESRGRTSALIFAFVNLSAFPLAMVLSTLSLMVSSLALASWRAVGLVIFAYSKPSGEQSAPSPRSPNIASVFHDRHFVLYLIPWLMFSIIDALEKVLLKDFIGSEYNALAVATQPIIAGVSMLIGGLLSDKIGRKRVVMYGFISLGIAYAIIGIAPMLQLAWNIYFVADAVAAGILWIIFIMVLWGDLAPQDSREKYYVVGSLPFLATAAIPSSLIPLSDLLPSTTAFSLASFFLFLAVLPLMYAPETLPQKKIELQRLRGYLDQAKKLASKHSKEN
jgi:MFS family permease